MDLNLGLTGDPPNKERDAMRRRLAAQLLQGEKMPDQISSPGAARGLALASALKSLAGAALTIQQDRQDAEQSAKWGEMGRQFSSLLGGGGGAPQARVPGDPGAPQSQESPVPSIPTSGVWAEQGSARPLGTTQSFGAKPSGLPSTGILAQVPEQFRGALIEAAQRNGIVPETIAAQMKQESRFDPGAVGKAGEVGLMQILPSTARKPGFGMQGVDPASLRDPAANINFGVDYLAARARAKGADMRTPAGQAAALAAYNGGGDPNYVENVLRHDMSPAQRATFLRQSERDIAEGEKRGEVGITLGPNGLTVVDPERDGARLGRNQVSPDAAMLTRGGPVPVTPDLGAPRKVPGPGRSEQGGTRVPPDFAQSGDPDRGGAAAPRLTPEGVARLQQAALAAASAGHPQAAAFLQVAGQQAAMLERQNAQDLASRDREQARSDRVQDRADTRSFQERQFQFQQQSRADQRAFQERQFQDSADGRRQQREMAERQFEFQRQQGEQGRLPAGYRMGANGQAEAIPGLPPPAGERAPEGYRWNADRTAMEPIPGGPAEAQRAAAAGQRAEADAGRQRTTEDGLRGEYTKLTADFRTVQDAHAAIRAAAKSGTGAGDMSMLYAFNKLLDPGSVVRESEFAAAARAGSLGERMQGAVNAIWTGQKLPDSMRAAFLAESDNLLAARRQSYDQVTTAYRGLAERSGARPDQVLLPFAREPVPAVPGTSGIPAGVPQPQTGPQTGAQAGGRPQIPAQPAQSAEVKARTAQALAQARSRLGPGATDDEVLAETQRLLHGR